jgi:hypothetical protein
MNSISIKFSFENKTVEITDRFLLNFIDFAVRSMFGAVGGSLLDYEVSEIDAYGQEVRFMVNESDTYKLVSALTMVGSYGITRVKTSAKKMIS